MQQALSPCNVLIATRTPQNFPILLSQRNPTARAAVPYHHGSHQHVRSVTCTTAETLNPAFQTTPPHRLFPLLAAPPPLKQSVD
jgi:hypothetical protein